MNGNGQVKATQIPHQPPYQSLADPRIN